MKEISAQADAKKYALAAAGILALCFVFNLFARGLIESYAVFLLPMGEEFGWDRASLSSVYSLNMVLYGLCSPLAGILFDRLGPRFLYVFGISCFGAGFIASRYLTELWQFYLCLGLLGGLGAACLGMIPATALIRRWFSTNIATAASIASAGFGSGTLILAPLSQVLIEAFGWREAYFYLGTLILVLLPVVILLPWRKIMAGAPDSYHATSLKQSNNELAVSRVLIAALSGSKFWALFFIFMLTGAGVYILSLQSVAFLVANGFEPIEAAGAFGLTGVLSIGGMLAVGIGADRYGRRLSATISYAMTLIGAAGLYLIEVSPGETVTYILLGIFIVFFGLNLGARGPIIATIAAKSFDGRGFGVVYGALTAGQGFGAGLGSWLAGFMFDVTGGYFASFVGCYVFICIALALFWLVPGLQDDRS